AAQEAAQRLLAGAFPGRQRRFTGQPHHVFQRVVLRAQQELDVLRPQDNPLEHMVRLARESQLAPREGTGEQALRGFLGSFNFSGDMVKQAVGTMSGGEKARLVLAMMVWQRPNLLLLDEPTNHLDLATREALAVALNEFEGTLMLVSHDRALLRSVCDEFWLVGRGAVTDFDGDLDDYQRYLLDEAKRMREEAKMATRAAAAAAPAVVAAAPAPAPAQAPAPGPVSGLAAAAAPSLAPAPTSEGGRAQRQQSARDRQQQQEQSRPLRKELTQIDTRLAQAAQEKAALEAELQQPLPPAQIAEAGRRLKQIDDEVTRLEERWLVLSEQIEALSA
ncbi:MAG: ATP-binding cassette domain-containing protein, partial [Comamonadaceae bacterium]